MEFELKLNLVEVTTLISCFEWVQERTGLTKREKAIYEKAKDCLCDGLVKEQAEQLFKIRKGECIDERKF